MKLELPSDSVRRGFNRRLARRIGWKREDILPFNPLYPGAVQVGGYPFDAYRELIFNSIIKGLGINVVSIKAGSKKSPPEFVLHFPDRSEIALSATTRAETIPESIRLLATEVSKKEIRRWRKRVLKGKA